MFVHFMLNWNNLYFFFLIMFPKLKVIFSVFFSQRSVESGNTFKIIVKDMQSIMKLVSGRTWLLTILEE